MPGAGELSRTLPRQQLDDEIWSLRISSREARAFQELYMSYKKEVLQYLKYHLQGSKQLDGLHALKYSCSLGVIPAPALVLLRLILYPSLAEQRPWPNVLAVPKALVPEEANHLKTSTRAGAAPGVVQLPVSTSNPKTRWSFGG